MATHFGSQITSFGALGYSRSFFLEKKVWGPGEVSEDQRQARLEHPGCRLAALSTSTTAAQEQAAAADPNCPALPVGQAPPDPLPSVAALLGALSVVLSMYLVHMVSFFEMQRVSGAVAGGVNKACQSASAFFASALMFCTDARPAQCLTELL